VQQKHSKIISAFAAVTRSTGNRLLCRSSQFRDRPLGASKLSRQLPNTHLLCSQRAYLVDYLQTQLPTDKFAILADFEQLSTTRRLIRTEYPYTGCRTAKVLSRLNEVRKVIAFNEDSYRELACKFATYQDKFLAIPLHVDQSSVSTPNWVNTWFPGLDAISLYGLLAIHNPRSYVEVRSGMSTKFAKRAICDISCNAFSRAVVKLHEHLLQTLCLQWTKNLISHVISFHMASSLCLS
jgi:hypothetical protein